MKQRCIENQRTIFEAAVRYEQDNSSSLQSIADQGGTIRDTLYNAGYVKNVSSFQCPASPQKGYNSSYILLYGSRNDLTNTGCYWYPAQHIYH